MRVLAFDIGKRCGFGLLGGNRILSGSHEIVETWDPLGAKLKRLETHFFTLIDEYKPDVLAVARPFVRYGDTPKNLVPMYGGFAVLHLVAYRADLRLEVMQESDARKTMLGKDCPRASAKVKLAIKQACRDRGWPCCDDHAGDALCIASAVTEKLNPTKAHMTTPLFQAKRRRRRAS